MFMNIIGPLAGFYWRQNQQITKLVGSGPSSSKSTQEVIDLATAAVAFLKKYYPALNGNNLLDDALATLKDILAPPANLS
jgi:hypothetical protein